MKVKNLLSLPAVITLGVAVGAAVLGPAAPASASCSHSHSDLDSHNHGGSAYVRVTGSAVAMRGGPHTTCGLVDRFNSGTYMYPWCYVFGDSVTRNGQTYSSWSFVHLAAEGDPLGWISDAYLSGGGSDEQC